MLRIEETLILIKTIPDDGVSIKNQKKGAPHDWNR